MMVDPILEAVLTRRSCVRLTGPAPDHDDLVDLIQAAATAPDHGLIRPWRLIIVEGDDRQKLGEAMRDTAADLEQGQRAATRPLRAPLLLSIVFCPARDHPVVREWEQLAAVAGMVQTLQLLLHNRGWGTIWRTGSIVEAPPVRDHLGLTATEQLLGWLYIGTSPKGALIPVRKPVDVVSRISWPRSAARV
jgi:nitroreductase